MHLGGQRQGPTPRPRYSGQLILTAKLDEIDLTIPSKHPGTWCSGNLGNPASRSASVPSQPVQRALTHRFLGLTSARDTEVSQVAAIQSETRGPNCPLQRLANTKQRGVTHATQLHSILVVSRICYTVPYFQDGAPSLGTGSLCRLEDCPGCSIRTATCQLCREVAAVPIRSLSSDRVVSQLE